MIGTPTRDDLRPDLDDADLETLRNAFVEAYNARDLDAVIELVANDVETPSLSTDGRTGLAEDILANCERSLAAILTQATVDEAPVALAWLPDEGGRWTRAGLVTFDGEQGVLTVVEMPDDDDALLRALSDSPVGDPLDEEQDWSEWDRGEDSEDAGWGWDESQVRD